jgi:hypothetical protein
MKKEKIIDKIKKLRKRQTLFCYSEKTTSYNEAIDDVLNLIKGK